LVLSDVKVLDLTHFIAGPFCTKYLADYGADVIKIEKNGAGDGARHLGPFPRDNPHPEKSGLFLFLNTNKRGITLNLKSPSGTDIVKRLAQNADILVENFRPGVMAGLGLGYETLSKINPRLVYTSISNFGQNGPYRNYKTTELVSQALGGVSLTCGVADREPVRLAGPQSQFHAGLVAAVATMFAFRLARKTGVGQLVDVSIMEAEINIHELDMMSYPYSGEHHMKRNGSFVGNYPWSIYPCQDGLVAVCLNNRQWRRIGDWLGMPELSQNPDYATPAQRLARMDELEAILVPWLAQRTTSEVTTSAQKARIPVLPVNSIKETLEDRHFQARNYFANIDHPIAGEFKYPGLPFKIAPAAKNVPRPAPTLGQHNQEIYCGELGYSKEELVYFNQTGVI